MRANRPAIVLTSDYELWIGNPGDAPLALEPSELFGFSTGAYEEVTLNGASAQQYSRRMIYFFFEFCLIFSFPQFSSIAHLIQLYVGRLLSMAWAFLFWISGAVTTDPKGLLLRFKNDLTLVADEEKSIVSICEYLRHLATEKGIGSVGIEDHILNPRMQQERQSPQKRMGENQKMTLSKYRPKKVATVSLLVFVYIHGFIPEKCREQMGRSFRSASATSSSRLSLARRTCSGPTLWRMWRLRRIALLGLSTPTTLTKSYPMHVLLFFGRPICKTLSDCFFNVHWKRYRYFYNKEALFIHIGSIHGSILLFEKYSRWKRAAAQLWSWRRSPRFTWPARSCWTHVLGTSSPEKGSFFSKPFW